MNTWKANLEETKERYISWWAHKGLILNMWEHLQEGVVPHAAIPVPEAPGSLSRKWFDPEWRSRWLDWYVAHSSFKADILPVANTQLGPGSLAAILGGVLEGGEDTIWIHPDPAFRDEIRFDERHPNWLLHKDLLKACKERAQGHYYVGMPDLMEGLDVLAALKGTDKVLLDLAVQPETVEKQLQAINDVYFRVFDELYDIIREGDEMAFCYFSSWAPGKMTKLQSDISTMIGEDDYRRFVQPFIREQCRKIPYTLYHLDGVGAVRHLPALLEIEELKAIQWTPGVGQPQGGSPKWYDLYRRILEGGKSVMACWVTLDELAPLLHAIGTDGVHLEMDFHNEEEIEQAIKIMKEFTSKTPLRACCSPAAPSGEKTPLLNPVRPDLEKALRERILILDGGQGTTIQQYKLSEDQFRGPQYAGCGLQLKGCNDLLNLTNPGINADVIRRFIEAGADIVTTHTFNAQRISLQGFHLENRVREINLAACSIARGMAQLYSTPDKPVFVAGGVGPTSKCITLGAITRKELTDVYFEQIQALVDGGVDCILIETVFDTENALAALDAFKRTGSKLPVIMSFTIKDPKGFNMLGQDILAFMLSLKDEPVMCVGLNCSLGAEMMLPFLRKIAANVPQYVIAFPNAGLPDKDGKYSETPKMMQKAVWPLVEDHVVNILGGCCGTDDTHIREIAKLVEIDNGLFVTPHRKGQAPAAPAPQAGKAEAPKAEAAETKAAEVKPEAPKAAASAAPKTEAPAAQSGDDALYEAVLKGKLDAAKAATQAAVDKGIAPQDIINGDMIRAMSQIGQDFQDGKAYVPQLLMAARAMKGAMEILKPLMVGQKVETLGKVVIGTVKGDLHDIGKNLVASMLEGCGFEVLNIGVDVPKEKFVAAIQENKADILCMSALLTTTMPQMKEVIEALTAAGVRGQVKIMVGGAPLSQEFADEIGADGYSDNANSAVALAKHLLNK